MSNTPPPEQLSPVKRALLALEEMEARVRTLESARTEPIAIIGMACRFPGGATSPDAFWQVLEHGVDGVCEIPAERWNIDQFYDPDPAAPGKIYTRWGAFLKQIDQFDPEFFGISPREATRMDPQQRLLLEVAWEALEDAGQAIDQLAGSATGVFVGVGPNEFERVQYRDPANITTYTGTGGVVNIIPGRLSYLLNLQGPAIAVDTACSSSLVAIHLACQSLRLNECTMAVAGGVNVLLLPDIYLFTSRMQMLSPDGRCKTFDARANGLVRGEGCGVVVLKRLSQALSDGDPILALIRGSAVNQDGRSASLTAPNVLAQKAVIRQALQNAGIEPGVVSYIETHGTGTALGDPIEVEALASIYGAPQADGQPCVLGAAKTNIGHLESAAGVAGLIKTVLSMRHAAIPPLLHFTTLNPNISLQGTRFELGTEMRPWQPQGQRRYAALSSFGWSGTNVHMLLEEAPSRDAADASADERPYLLPISARDPRALKSLAQAYHDLLHDSHPPALLDLAFSATTRRMHHAHRLAVVGASAVELADQLAAFLNDESHPGVAVGRLGNEPLPKATFVFSGQGAQWAGMGRGLIAQEPIFRQEIERIDRLLRQYADWSLLEQLQADETHSRLDETAIAQAAIFAVQVGLTALWRARGVVPAAVVGHSIGEVAAAYVAGVLSLEDAVRVVFHRGRLMQRATGHGQMVMVSLGVEAAEQLCRPDQGRIEISAVNGPSETILAGEPEAIVRLCAALQEQHVFYRLLPVRYAFHTAQMEPFQPELVEALRGITVQPATLPIFSTVTASRASASDFDARYWGRNIREPVRFAQTIDVMLQAGQRLFVEISPHPVLHHGISESLRAHELRGTVVSSLRRNVPEPAALLRSMGTLYTLGYTLDWQSLYPNKGRCVALPRYPWQRERYWPEDLISPFQPVQRSHPTRHAILGPRVSPATQPGTHFWESVISLQEQPYLADHQVQGLIVVPGAAYLQLVLGAAQSLAGPQAYVVERITFTRMLLLEAQAERTVQVMLKTDGDQGFAFEICSRPADDGTAEKPWTVHATGRIRAAAAPTEQLSRAEIQARCYQQIDGAVYYDTLAAEGLTYGPSFRGIAELWRRDGEALARLSPAPNVLALGENDPIHPALLDSCFQVCRAALPMEDASGNAPNPGVLAGIEQLAWFGSTPPTGELWAYARTDQAVASDNPAFNLTLFGSQGEIILHIEGLSTRQVEGSAASSQNDVMDRWLYRVQWQPQERSTAHESNQPSRAGGWLLFVDANRSGMQIAEQLTKQAQRCVIVTHGDHYQMAGDTYQIDPNNPEHFKQLLKDAFPTRQGPCRGMVYGWSLDAPRSADTTPDRLLEAQPLVCYGVLYLVQGLAHVGWRDLPRIWLVTRGAQAVDELGGVGSVAQAPLWGLSSVIRHEYPQLHCTTIDLDPEQSEDHMHELFSEIWTASPEDQIALRRTGRYVARLMRTSKVELQAEAMMLRPAGTDPFQLEVADPETPERLLLRAAERRSPGPDEVELEVVAATHAGPCAGRVVALGAGITDLHRDQLVLALTPAPLRRFVTAEQRVVLPIPAALSCAAAVALASAGLTAAYSLRQARLAPGDRLLIHHPAHPAGLLALQLAQRQGATVIAAVQSDEERTHVQALGAALVVDAHAPTLPTDLLAHTDGYGVDVVLDGLAGPLHPHSADLLREGGILIDAGAGNVPALVGRNLAVTRLDIPGLLVRQPTLARTLMQELLQQAATGLLTLPPETTLPIGDVRTAPAAPALDPTVLTFHAAAHTPIVQGQTAATLPIRADATYLLTGGLGGLGLTVAQWLVAQGARSLLLIGRRPPTAAQQPLLDALRDQGAALHLVAADVSDFAALAAALQDRLPHLPPLRGVFHAAGLLDDGVLLQQTAARFATVGAPKLAGSWHLHHLTAALPLDWFVLCSSAASVLGSPGQGNYAAANAFLDALAAYRRGLGLPALSINWGPWAEVGLAAARSDRGERLGYRGIGSIAPEQGVAVLGQLLRAAPPQIAVLPLNLRQWQQYHLKAAAAPLLSQLMQEQHAQPTQRTGLVRANLIAAAPEQRLGLLEAHISEQVHRIMHLPKGRIDRQTPLGLVGLESLMALELRNSLENSLELSFPVALIWNYQSIADLSAHLIERLELTAPPREAAAPVTTTEEQTDLADLLSQLTAFSVEELQQSFAVESPSKGNTNA